MSKKKKKIVAVSGGFDPIHIGHVRMIQDARKLGNVIVFLNTDDWLKRKKGYVFMPWEERAEILLGIKGVKEVYSANGGDRKPGHVPEYQVCEDLGIEMAFSVGGDDKPQSSSWLVEKSKYAKIDHGDGIVF